MPLSSRVLLLLAAMVAPEALASPPGWYLSNRIHAHTRLSISSYCGNDTGTWTCEPVFEEAASRFASLGVKAYVRHTHTGPEGLWWPSTSDPPEAWHPLVRATNRSLPQEFLQKAAAADINVIFYHYMKTNEYYASAHPEWVQRGPEGKPIIWPRGTGLSPCADAWTDTYIAQIKQLVEMGARAFYFDEYPASLGGDWSDACKEKFRERFGEDMPVDVYPKKNHKTPFARDPRVQILMSQVTEEYFRKLAAAIYAAAPDAVALISIYKVPEVDNGFDVPAYGLYETTALVAQPNTAAKTEIEIAGRPSIHPGINQFDFDVRCAFGYSMARDAAQGAEAGASPRPAHMWIPFLTGKSPERAVCASAALVAYGAIANPDHKEVEIPNATLFNSTYALSKALTEEIFADLPNLEPLQYAAVLFPERSRNAMFAADRNSSRAWSRLLSPTLGAFRSLVRAGWPATVVTDWQLANWTSVNAATRWPAILAPADADLDAETVAALGRYAAAGGAVVRVNASWDWADYNARSQLGIDVRAMVRDATKTKQPPALATRPDAKGMAGVLATFYKSPERSDWVVFLANNLTACHSGPTLPPPASGYAIELSGIESPPTRAFEAVTRVELNVTQGPDKGSYLVNVPTFDYLAAVRFSF